MNETIRTDILKVLDKAIEILETYEQKDVVELKELSNHTIHNASIFQDSDSISIAVAIYALSKLLERGVYTTKSTNLLKECKQNLLGNDYHAFKESLKKLFKLISYYDKRLKLYIEDVIDQGQIKKGSKLYEHGLSIERAASLLGISQWELMDYIGKTRIADSDTIDSMTKNRLNLAKKIFGLK